MTLHNYTTKTGCTEKVITSLLGSFPQDHFMGYRSRVRLVGIEPTSMP